VDNMVHGREHVFGRTHSIKNKRYEKRKAGTKKVSGLIITIQGNVSCNDRDRNAGVMLARCLLSRETLGWANV